MRLLLRIVLLAAAFALATYAFGWVAVPILAAMWGVLARHTPAAARDAAMGALAGWAVLLVWAALSGPVWVLADQLGGVMKIPRVLLLAITLSFPALLAWATTTTVAALSPLASRRPA